MNAEQLQLGQDGRLAASRYIFVPACWSDGWSWDRRHFPLFIFVPFILFTGLILIFSFGFPPLAARLAHFFWLGLVGIPFAAVYAGMGVRLRNIKSRLSGDFVEATDCVIAQNNFKSPGVAVLRADSLELIRISGQSIAIPFPHLAEVRQITWFNNAKHLYSKMGFEIRVANLEPIQFAVPFPVGVRWQTVLKSAPTGVPPG
jgi:hypothetical protein